MHVKRLVRGVGLVATVAAASLFLPTRAEAQNCLSPNPADWPPPAKPYFMIIQDTSGSMVTCTNPPSTFPATCASNATKNSCNMLPSRLNDAKCALRKTVQAFGGEVNFGLETFGVRLFGCTNTACVDGCTAADGTCPTISAGVGTLGDYYAGNGCGVLSFPDADSGVPAGTALSCGNRPNCVGAGPGSPNFAKGTWRNGGNIVVDLAHARGATK